MSISKKSILPYLSLGSNIHRNNTKQSVDILSYYQFSEQKFLNKCSWMLKQRWNMWLSQCYNCVLQSCQYTHQYQHICHYFFWIQEDIQTRHWQIYRHLHRCPFLELHEEGFSKKKIQMRSEIQKLNIADCDSKSSMWKSVVISS